MYDIVIIGAGAAGIEAARQALKKKKKTVLIDVDPALYGGTCLNRGCIPAKLYLHHGGYEKNPARLYEEKEKLVGSIKKKSLQFLHTQGLEFLWGSARFINDREIAVGEKRIQSQYYIIATGSHPRDFLGVDNKKIFFAETLFSFKTLPGKFLIVGGGAIGVEFASLLHTLSRKVTVIEKEPRILLGFDSSIVQRLKTYMSREGIDIHTGADAAQYDFNEYDMVLLAAGRVPHTQGLNLDAIGIQRDQSQRVLTNEFCQTNLPHIYACGDVTAEKMYAYIGEYQGRICVENIAGNSQKYSVMGIPEGVFTIPQLAQVGIQEEQLEQERTAYRALKTHFRPFSSSSVYHDDGGYLKILIDEKGALLGATLLSRGACELISIFAYAIRNRMSIDSLKKSVFMHPTIAEIITKLTLESE
ncbi:MAG: NAD(P)/FAD-dependent oxidoreductase [Candidatus Omnitrophica bacterium]|nr:NAD(P)/FAD-dependent oxidoreductase [Candidatus Omnitrophota bacterium]